MSILEIQFCELLTTIKDDIFNVNDHRLLKQYTRWLEVLNEPNWPNKTERNRYLLELARQIHCQDLSYPITLNPHKMCGRTTRVKKVQRKESANLSPNCKRSAILRCKKKMGNGLRSDNSSWIDLSGSESSEQLSTDGEKESQDGPKIGRRHVEEGLKLREHYLKKFEEERKQPKNADVGFTDNLMQKEVEALKLRMKDLLEVKNALKDTHHLTEDRKRTIEVLQKKLDESQRKNKCLKMLLARQTRNLSSLTANKEVEMSRYKETFEEYRLKQIDMINHRHLEEKQNMEISYQNQIIELQNDFKTQLEALKSNYETKINEVVRNNASIIQEKDQEIGRIKNMMNTIEKNSEQSKNDGSGEQVIHLKKCVSKLDKLLGKNERESLRKIEKLKQEIRFKEVSTQIQLQTQKADLMVRFAALRKKELEEALNILEGKYREIVNYFQNSNDEKCQQTDYLIQDLKKVLDENDFVPYRSS